MRPPPIIHDYKEGTGHTPWRKRVCVHAEDLRGFEHSLKRIFALYITKDNNRRLPYRVSLSMKALDNTELSTGWRPREREYLWDVCCVNCRAFKHFFRASMVTIVRFIVVLRATGNPTATWLQFITLSVSPYLLIMKTSSRDGLIQSGFLFSSQLRHKAEYVMDHTTSKQPRRKILCCALSQQHWHRLGTCSASGAPPSFFNLVAF